LELGLGFGESSLDGWGVGLARGRGGEA
jgi:hypothetical protein